MSSWKAALWLLPLLVSFSSACWFLSGDMFENCDGIVGDEFESGVFLTSASSGDSPTPLANRLDKTLTLDATARTLVLEYDDADGNAVVENWTYVVVE